MRRVQPKATSSAPTQANTDVSVPVLGSPAAGAAGASTCTAGATVVEAPKTAVVDAVGSGAPTAFVLLVVGAEVLGAAVVVGAEVLGAEVVGAEVVGAEVVGAEVVGAEVEVSA